MITARYDIRIKNMVITYLYSLLDNDIYMKIHERFKMPEAYDQMLMTFIQLSYNDLCVSLNNLKECILTILFLPF